MKLGYAYKSENEGFVAKAQGVELDIKFKHAREICAAIQGKKARDAIDYLERVLENKAYIPFKKVKKKGAHKKGEGLVKCPFGKQPVKATDGVIKVLKAAVANSESKGLDVDNCIIVSALAQKGRSIRRVRPKGRHAVYNIPLTTVQIVIEEVSSE